MLDSYVQHCSFSVLVLLSQTIFSSTGGRTSLVASHPVFPQRPRICWRQLFLLFLHENTIHNQSVLSFLSWVLAEKCCLFGILLIFLQGSCLQIFLFLPNWGLTTALHTHIISLSNFTLQPLCFKQSFPLLVFSPFLLPPPMSPTLEQTSSMSPATEEQSVPQDFNLDTYIHAGRMGKLFILPKTNLASS